MKTYGVEHVTSSPRYTQSNEKVENAVKVANTLMEKSVCDGTDPYLALLDWRNTPTEAMNSSPAQRMFSRRTKTLLPKTAKLLKPEVVTGMKQDLFRRKEKQTKYYNRGAKELSKLHDGDVVRIKPVGKEKNWVKARVEGQVDIRSYQVRTEDGAVYRRNRRHLRSNDGLQFYDQNTEIPSVVNQPVQSSGNDINQSTSSQNTVVPNNSLVNNQAVSTVPSQTDVGSRNTEQVPVRSSSRQVRKPVWLKDFVTR